MNPQLKRTLMRAAKLQRVNLSEFVIRSSQAAAEMALADRTRFVLSPAKWEEFNAALDASPRDIPALRRLFGERSVFDRE
jgi:uncharacterized protein (DUF1778 family)